MCHPPGPNRRKGLGNVELQEGGLLAGYPRDVDVMEEGGEEVGGRPAFHRSGELRRQDARLPCRLLEPSCCDAFESL